MKAIKVWFEDEKIFILTDDNQTLYQSLMWYPLLSSASEHERSDYRISEDGIHWRKLDEDVSFESFLYEDKEPSVISKIFKIHPELNASAIARKLNIQQSLLAAYISGIKKPSAEREKEILSFIHKLGEELQVITTS